MNDLPVVKVLVVAEEIGAAELLAPALFWLVADEEAAGGELNDDDGRGELEETSGGKPEETGGRVLEETDGGELEAAGEEELEAGEVELLCATDGPWAVIVLVVGGGEDAMLEAVLGAELTLLETSGSCAV